MTPQERATLTWQKYGWPATPYAAEFWWRNPGARPRDPQAIVANSSVLTEIVAERGMPHCWA